MNKEDLINAQYRADWMSKRGGYDPGDIVGKDANHFGPVIVIVAWLGYILYRKIVG